MLLEREAQKKKEYSEREAVDVEEITEGEVTKKDAGLLDAADRAYLFESSANNKAK